MNRKLRPDRTHVASHLCQTQFTWFAHKTYVCDIGRSANPARMAHTPTACNICTRNKLQVLGYEAAIAGALGGLQT
jgi:hypothetical protein